MTALSASRQQLPPPGAAGELKSPRRAVQRFAPVALRVPASGDLTREDVLAAASKWNAASSFLDKYWRGQLSARGISYTSPRVRHTADDVVETGCGTLERDGPFYCPVDHTIYCDPLFVAAEMKRIGKRLGTDGDMAAIVILAHEWGHAVQRLAGVRNPSREVNELQADWPAGSFARLSYYQGVLEEGDPEEAQMVLADGGDCRDSPGAPAARVNSFWLGFQHGEAASGILQVSARDDALTYRQNKRWRASPDCCPAAAYFV